MGGGDGDGRREGGRRREERSSVQFSSPSRPFLLTDFSLARAGACGKEGEREAAASTYSI